ncbi:hypothetical protein E4U58_005734 [Claviceps cyperi]|nr:hypothetical protein E4U58_005734 [Claviceps cyperi]
MTERMVKAMKPKSSMTMSHDNEDEDEHKDELLDNATMIDIARHHRGLDHLNYCIVEGQWMHSGASGRTFCCDLLWSAMGGGTLFDIWCFSNMTISLTIEISQLA